ncbi:hypothetical protein EIP86_001179 [Pleurotus ostreatoroseus]|nr:hypothetical protein EIP86_001179 [Pleurotus ostreatoroseus]
MADEIITKRLHVSGLTPAIRPTDLSQKLGSFGIIKALDGFEQVDGLGNPRKFGYVTIETTKSKLARCMNLLSGVTWKGAKLRIGEAKPDFRERIAREHKAAEEEPSRKKRRLPRDVQGVHAPDMSLVTPENVHDRGGWRVTPLGRIVRPVRMRPEHPLPEPLASTSKAKETKKGTGKKTKKVKPPPVRARRRTIDPTKWDSQHLKGVFLENVVVASSSKQPRALVAPEEEPSASDSEYLEEDDEREDAHEAQETTVEATKTDVQPLGTPSRSRSASPTAPITDVQPVVSIGRTEDPALAEERNAALGLLQSMFGDGDNWGGEESIDSDVDMDAIVETKREAVSAYAGEDDFEVVPMDVDRQPNAGAISSPDPEIEEQQPDPQITRDEPVASDSAPNKSVKLKDLFAPREEEGGFSLLGHLDLDLDLDDDVLDASFAPAPPAATPSIQPVVATTIRNTRTQAQVTFDPNLPLFFPLPQDEREGFRGRVRDPFDVAKEQGFDWRTFCRTETSEEIRQRWEAEKVELTRDWKRRHREAVKSRRRRGGDDGE